MKISGSSYNILFNYNNDSCNDETRKKLQEQRKEDPVLDRALYQNDMANLMSDMAKAEAIARKAAKGEAVTEEEKKFIEEFDPERMKKAEKAKEEAKRLKECLRHASTKQEAQGLVMQALTSAAQIIEAGDQQYGQLLIDAIKSEIDDNNVTNGSKINGYKNNTQKGKYFEASA